MKIIDNIKIRVVNRTKNLSFFSNKLLFLKRKYIQIIYITKLAKIIIVNIARIGKADSPAPENERNDT
jgi:hypothetical protein